jgi:hypothetical protein
MRIVLNIGARYHCKCGNEWFKMWTKKPWFSDHARPCKKCKRSVWPSSMRDYSYTEMTDAERSWDNR